MDHKPCYICEQTGVHPSKPATGQITFMRKWDNFNVGDSIVSCLECASHFVSPPNTQYLSFDGETPMCPRCSTSVPVLYWSVYCKERGYEPKPPYIEDLQSCLGCGTRQIEIDQRSKNGDIHGSFLTKEKAEKFIQMLQ